MWIRKSEIADLSANLRKIIDGKQIDIRDNKEGPLSILKNDIHTLSNRLIEQSDTLAKEKRELKNALADISHQIKTPLTSVMVMADLLEDAPADKFHEFLRNIKINIKRTDWLVSTLLKMAKLDAGATVIRKEPINASELFSAAVETLTILLDIKGQRVISDIQSDVIIECDRRLTVEALSNIIKNASESSPENAEIHIKADTNPICSLFSVTDTGKGIPLTEIPKLFTRFSGATSENGFGIGLPLAYSIMRAQNGDIDVESTLGKGSVFTLKFYR